ncbi:hypothetical protein GCM10028805_49550 [Spirosoma harenae]
MHATVDFYAYVFILVGFHKWESGRGPIQLGVFVYVCRITINSFEFCFGKSIRINKFVVFLMD